MVYAVISDIKWGSLGANSTGSVRLVNKGEIVQPRDILGDINGPSYHDEHYFSSLQDARVNFKQVKKGYSGTQYQQVRFSDET
jgi:hypothetical protein